MAANQREDALHDLVDGLHKAADQTPRGPDKSRLRTAAESLSNAPEEPTKDVMVWVIQRVAEANGPVGATQGAPGQPAG